MGYEYLALNVFRKLMTILIIKVVEFVNQIILIYLVVKIFQYE